MQLMAGFLDVGYVPLSLATLYGDNIQSGLHTLSTSSELTYLYIPHTHANCTST